MTKLYVTPRLNAFNYSAKVDGDQQHRNYTIVHFISSARVSNTMIMMMLILAF